METCQYDYESDDLLLRIVDTTKNWKEFFDVYHQFGEELALINNQIKLDDINMIWIK